MRYIGILSLLFFLSNCASLFKETLHLERASFKDLHGWHSDNHNEALISFIKSCEKFASLPHNHLLHDSGIGGRAGDWKRVCEEAVKVHRNGSSSAATVFFENHFQPYRAVSSRKSKGLFTGYFEAGLQGSKVKTERYRYPLYAKPDDIIAGKTYHSHRAINKGALDGRDLELLWVDNPVERFFLHIQGSGQVTLPDGSMIRVGYDGKNNHDYRSIGRYMIDEGWIAEEDMSAQAIKEWLRMHPEKLWHVLEYNPSYVFFKEIGDISGPIGAQGVSLTPMRSLAIDKTKLPYGVPVWLETELTAVNHSSAKAFNQLLIAQDTGSAIKGAIRGDIFFGAGHLAQELAGYQNSEGRYFILLPRK